MLMRPGVPCRVAPLRLCLELCLLQRFYVGGRFDRELLQLRDHQAERVAAPTVAYAVTIMLQMSLAIIIGRLLHIAETS